MKKAFLSAAIIGAISMSSQASAFTITDVGGEDIFVGSTTLSSSGDAAELAWVQDILNDQTITFSDKYDSYGSDWQLVDGETDVYAADLAFDPEYYLIKMGTGGTNIDSHFLFENIGDLSYAVVDFSDAGIDFSIKKLNIGRISHVGEFGSSTIDVPEPANLALFGLGIVALGFSRKRTAQ